MIIFFQGWCIEPDDEEEELTSFNSTDKKSSFTMRTVEAEIEMADDEFFECPTIYHEEEPTAYKAVRYMNVVTRESHCCRM